MDDYQDAWGSGSYEEFARSYLPMAATLVEAADVGKGETVLDVGCGTGNVAITAGRLGADVTGVDVSSTMLERAASRAARAGVGGVDWREGDATDLPLADGSFDVALSALGHVYGDPPDEAARELLRVTRPGGRVGFTSWTPTSLFPILFGHVMTHLPKPERPEFTDPPFVWGDRDIVRDRLGHGLENLAFETGTATFRALSPTHFWDVLSSRSGVFAAFLERVHDRSELRDAVVETIDPYFDDSRNAVELEYILATGTVTGQE